jgi:hypothetical protein
VSTTSTDEVQEAQEAQAAQAARFDRDRAVIARCRAVHEGVTGLSGDHVRVSMFRQGEYTIEGAAGATTLEHAAGVLEALQAGSLQVRGPAVLLRGWWSVLVHAGDDDLRFVVVVTAPADVAAMTAGVAGECEACQARAARALVTAADDRVRLCGPCLVKAGDLISDVRATPEFLARTLRAGLADAGVAGLLDAGHLGGAEVAS